MVISGNIKIHNCGRVIRNTAVCGWIRTCQGRIMPYILPASAPAARLRSSHVNTGVSKKDGRP